MPLALAWLTVALFSLGASAEPHTNATCTDQLWSFNSRQQSPCLVSAYLGAQCINNNWGVDALNPGGGAYILTAALANRCLCNSVLWNLLSACTMCQREPAGTWSQWIGNCPDAMVAVGRYPAQIPPAVVVPHWAYYDFTPTGIFDAAVAQQQLGPESSMVISTSQTYPTDTGTAIVTGTNTALFTPTPTGTKTPNPASNNTGPIVGGVVGGILGVALIALIGYILVRRNQAKNSTTVQYAQGGFNPTAGSQPNLGSPVMAHQPRPGVPYATTGLEYKPYNPSDPSTYPSDAGTSTYYAESLPYSHSPGPRPGQYTGAPQV